MGRRTLLEPTDDELIREIGAGSDLAFDRLMRRHRRLVFRVAYGLTGDSESALDVVQETFLKVHTRLGSFRGEGKVRNWIVRIAAHEALNWRRSSRRLEASELDETSFVPPDQRPERDPMTVRALTRSLAALGPRHRL